MLHPLFSHSHLNGAQGRYRFSYGMSISLRKFFFINLAKEPIKVKVIGQHYIRSNVLTFKTNTPLSISFIK